MSMPNLPGFYSNKGRAGPRPQTFSASGGVVFEKESPATYTEADHHAKIVERAHRTSRLDTKAKEDLISTKRSLAATRTAPEVPVEVELDRQVLRVNAFFQEAVHESPLEHFRVRQVDILLYLVDMSLQIIEHREENSGLPQGTMLKRHRIAKRAGAGGDVEFYGWQDLFIGNEVTFYGRTYRIVNCDAFTREWFAERGYDQGEPEPIPTDAAAIRAELERTTGPKKEHHGKEMYPTKRFMEARLGKHIEDPDKLRRFLAHDRQILRFDCVWDDTASLYGDRNNYTLNYFLSNDTVQILEVKTTNSGKDPYPALLARQPLPRDYEAAKAAGTPEDNPHLYYRAEDLIVGSTIHVLGRDLLIRACDPFTRTFYKEHFGIMQPPPLEAEEPEERKAEVPIPPPTGFGDDEDSLASFHSLVPKVPKKDFNKYMEYDREVYRFKARFVDPIPEDAMRRFVIQVYPQDDTVGVYEPAIRNSGIVGGKFLARGKHKKADGSLYQPSDFVVGTEVEVCRRRFFIEGTDDFTAARVPGVAGSSE